MSPLYLTELHAHTKEVSPCGRVPAKKLVQLYQSAGYTTVVITDHFSKAALPHADAVNWDKVVDRYLKGYLAAKEAAGDTLHILFGMELTFCESPNDYLCYGFTEEKLRRCPGLLHRGIAAFHEFAVQEGILVFQAHPFRPKLTRAEPNYLDGIEVYNGNKRHDSHNDQAQAWAAEHRLLISSGSDFHQKEDLGRGGVLTHFPIRTTEDLFRALQGELRLKRTL